MKKVKIKKLPDKTLLHIHFEYDFDTGKLFNKKTGKEAGWINDRGYRCLTFKKVTYYVHRLIFWMFMGRDPGKQCIDHIDGDKLNNRLVNLRPVTFRKNRQNTSTRRASGKIPRAHKGTPYFA